jgi:hypothetical protein
MFADTIGGLSLGQFANVSFQNIGMAVQLFY